jgi:hypothetical protein
LGTSGLFPESFNNNDFLGILLSLILAQLSSEMREKAPLKGRSLTQIPPGGHEAPIE